MSGTNKLESLNTAWDESRSNARDKANHLELTLLNPALLNLLFDCVYALPFENVETEPDFQNDFMPSTIETCSDRYVRAFLWMVEGIVQFNHWYRYEHKQQALDLLDRRFNFNRNSEGTDRWLGRALAVKELYGLTWSELKTVMNWVEVRK